MEPNLSKRQFSHHNPLTLAHDSDDQQQLTEEQQYLEQDIDSSHLTRRQKGIGQVRVAYDSDSSDDGETRRQQELISRRRKERKVQASGKPGNEDEDDDDDMFSDYDDKQDDDVGNEDLREAEEQLKAKKVEFLDLDEFEKEMEKDDSELNLNISLPKESSSLFDKITRKVEEDGEDEDAEEVTESNVDIDYFVHPELEFNSEDNQSGEEEMDVDADLESGSLEKRSRKPKPKQQPKLERFNLRDDMEEGRFDADGNFIRTAEDENAHQDAWLDDVSKKDILKARKAHLLREQEDLQKENTGVVSIKGDGQNEVVSKPLIPTSEFLERLVETLDVCETPLEALQKLQKEQQAEKKKKKQREKEERQAKREKTKGGVINSDSTDEDKAKEAAKAKERQQQVEEITECSESLMQRGFPDVYNMMREELQKQYQKETGQSYSLKRKRDLIDDLDDLDDLDEEDVDDNKPTLEEPQNTLPNTKQWEFKWTGSDEVHGPYDSETMRNWIRDEYFDERVKVRASGSSDPFISYDFVTYD